jgi:hypothetical protein
MLPLKFTIGWEADEKRLYMVTDTPTALPVVASL